MHHHGMALLQQKSDWLLLGERPSFTLYGLSWMGTAPSGAMPQSTPREAEEVLIVVEGAAGTLS